MIKREKVIKGLEHCTSHDDGRTEEKWGESPYAFADDLAEVPVAIIRNGWEGR